MREFLVTITTTVPDGTDSAEVDRRWAAEAVRAKELAASGNLVRLWKPAGGGPTISLWRADDETALHSSVLDTLPLREWMTFAVTELDGHPNDPVA